jgi:hypothetical protein
VCLESPCYCRKLDDWHTAIAAKKCAAHLLGGRECPDYRRGFTQAFVDVALGRTGQAPPVPPQRYWDVCFRSPCGQNRAADWYAGYREGAEIALARCGSTCRTIPTSDWAAGMGESACEWADPAGANWAQPSFDGHCGRYGY